MKDVEFRGKWFGFLWLVFHSQWGDHHIGCVSEEGLNPSLYDLHLKWPQVDALLTITNLLMFRGGDSRTPLAGEQLPHPRSGPWHGEMVYLTFSDNIDYSANRTGPYDQEDPLSELRLIKHHKECSVFIISFNPQYLHTQGDQPKRTSMFPT